jgi:hypothetical protein
MVAVTMRRSAKVTLPVVALLVVAGCTGGGERAA